MLDDDDDDSLNDDPEAEQEDSAPTQRQGQDAPTDSSPVRRIVSQFVHVTRWPFLEARQDPEEQRLLRQKRAARSFRT